MRSAVNHARRVRRRSLLLILGVTGIVALVMIAMLAPRFVTNGASAQTTTQEGPRIFALLVALGFGIWTLPKLLTMGPPPGATDDDQANSYTRATGTIALISNPVRSYGRSFFLETPDGERFQISRDLFSALAPSAKDAKGDPGSNPRVRLLRASDYLEIEHATLLYYRPISLVLQVTAANGRSLYRNPDLGGGA